MDEAERVRRLSAIFSADLPARAGVRRGVGDDAAVLAPAEGLELVVSTDAAIEGVHFLADSPNWHAIGRRAVHTAASDLAAMGARARWLVCAWALPIDFGDDAFEALARGTHDGAHELDMVVVGGNLTRASEVGITTTVLGEASRAVGRDGARAGDGVWLGGSLGLARIGLEARRTHRADDPSLAPAVRAYEWPRARADLTAVVRERASSCIDVSDGFALDTIRLAEASRVRIALDRAQLELSTKDTHALAGRVGLDAWDAVLAGGDDYALVATSRAVMDGFVRIGTVEEGEGVYLVEADGSRLLLRDGGFDHFARIALDVGAS